MMRAPCRRASTIAARSSEAFRKSAPFIPMSSIRMSTMTVFTHDELKSSESCY